VAEGPLSRLTAAPRRAAGALEFEHQLPRPTCNVRNFLQNNKRTFCKTECSEELSAKQQRNFLQNNKYLAPGLNAIRRYKVRTRARRSSPLRAPVAELAPPWVSARLVRCAGHFWPSDRTRPAARRVRQAHERTGRVVATASQPRATCSAM
jgi:hypothetical protein